MPEPLDAPLVPFRGSSSRTFQYAVLGLGAFFVLVFLGELLAVPSRRTDPYLYGGVGIAAVLVVMAIAAYRRESATIPNHIRVDADGLQFQYPSGRVERLRWNDPHFALEVRVSVLNPTNRLEPYAYVGLHPERGSLVPQEIGQRIVDWATAAGVRGSVARTTDDAGQTVEVHHYRGAGAARAT
jgi:hypothetical protein